MADGEKVDMWLRETLCFRKIRWQVEDHARTRIRALLHGRQLQSGSRPQAVAYSPPCSGGVPLQWRGGSQTAHSNGRFLLHIR